MPAIAPSQLVGAVIAGISESGYAAVLTSSARRNPRQFLTTSQNGTQTLTVYAWTLTFGGRPSLKDEYRIQMTGVGSPLRVEPRELTVLLGFEPNLNLFAGFDLQRHRTFTAGSPSVQIDLEQLRNAETDGLSFHRKSNDEIAVGIRPDMLMAYALNSEILHRYGRDAKVFKLLNEAVQHAPTPQQTAPLASERRRIVMEVNRLSREAGFRQRVLFAYGFRCAITRTQLQLVEAAHILPVGAPGSVDDVRNGIALSPTYHRAYDAGLIFLDEQFEMKLNEGRIEALVQMNRCDGLEFFRTPLGRIFLPPDPLQRPNTHFIRQGNKFRQISA